MTPYDLILADPPWRFENWTSEERAVRGEHWGRANGRSPYDCLDTPTIAGLPVARIAARDAVCFLWCTHPKLEEGFQVLRGWGFIPRTVAFTWTKLNPNGRVERRGKDLVLHGGLKMGLGYWTRQNPEPVLLGTRGQPGFMRESKSVENVILAPVGRHSAKPLEVYGEIRKLCGNRRRIELFARRREPGWDAIGDGIDGLDIRESLARVAEDLPLPGVGAEPDTRKLSWQQKDLLKLLFHLEQKGFGKVWRPGDWSPRWIATDRASASRTLRRLEARGLVRRHNAGGRTTHVELTEAGREWGMWLTEADKAEGSG